MKERTYIIQDDEEYKIPITKAEYVITKDGGLDDTLKLIEINKANQEDLDEVKQSGVKTNKILVDALNSKNVSASTKDSIKVNANKVNDISVGLKTAKFTGKNNEVKETFTLNFKPLQVICNVSLSKKGSDGSLYSIFELSSGLINNNSVSSMYTDANTTENTGHGIRLDCSMKEKSVEVKLTTNGNGVISGTPTYHILGV